MFHPNGVKKLLTWANSATIYHDGIVITERKTAKAGKYQKDIEVKHFQPFPEARRIGFDDNANFSWVHGCQPRERRVEFVNHITVYHCDLIANGFDKVDVSFHSQSESAERAGISLTHVNFQLGAQRWTDTSVNDMVSSGCSVYPNPDDGYFRSCHHSQPQSIRDLFVEYRRNGEYCEWHGDNEPA